MVMIRSTVPVVLCKGREDCICIVQLSLALTTSDDLILNPDKLDDSIEGLYWLCRN